MATKLTYHPPTFTTFIDEEILQQQVAQRQALQNACQRVLDWADMLDEERDDLLEIFTDEIVPMLREVVED